MAEFLVKANTLRPKFERGDIIVVKPNGWNWGKEENPQTASRKDFVLIKIPELDCMQARKYEAPESSIDSLPDGASVANITKRRKWKFLIDIIPQAIKDQLQTSGIVTLNWAQIEQYIEDKTA